MTDVAGGGRSLGFRGVEPAREPVGNPPYTSLHRSDKLSHKKAEILDNSLVLASYIYLDVVLCDQENLFGGTDTAIGTFICPHRVNSFIGLVTHQKKHSKTLLIEQSERRVTLETR